VTAGDTRLHSLLSGVLTPCRRLSVKPAMQVPAGRGRFKFSDTPALPVVGRLRHRLPCHGAGWAALSLRLPPVVGCQTVRVTTDGSRLSDTVTPPVFGRPSNRSPYPSDGSGRLSDCPVSSGVSVGVAGSGRAGAGGIPPGRCSLTCHQLKLKARPRTGHRQLFEPSGCHCRTHVATVADSASEGP
jgi:hypothetical protein